MKPAFPTPPTAPATGKENREKAKPKTATVTVPKPSSMSPVCVLDVPVHSLSMGYCTVMLFVTLLTPLTLAASSYAF
jgi:hypothetical protein